MFVRFLFVFDLLFNLFRIALWPPVGKELLGFSVVLFYLSRLNCRCPFPVWCLGQGVEFDCIGPISLPFYLLFRLIAWFHIQTRNKVHNLLLSLYESKKDEQLSGTDTIRSLILPSKPKGKLPNTYIDSSLRKARAVNRMNSSFPDRWSFRYLNMSLT